MNGPIDRLIEWARTRPDAPALIGLGARHSYADLLKGARARAAWLHACGVRAGDTVALDFSEPGGNLPKHVETFYAIAWLGATVLPLYPDLKEERRIALANQLGARWLIGQQLPGELNAQRLDPASYVAPQWMGASVPRGDTPDGRFFFEFTSGTTGIPKAMAPTHAEYGALHSNAAKFYDWRPDDIAMAPARWPAKVGIRNLTRVMYAGAGFLDLPFPQTRRELALLVEQHGLSYLHCSSWQLRALLKSQPLPRRALVPLRLLITAGSPVTPDEILTTRQSLVANFHVGYASTEICVMGHLGPDAPSNAPYQTLPGMQVQALDARGEPLPEGQMGRLRFRAPWLPKTYAVGELDRVEGFHGGWFVSSDLGSVDALGRIRLGGRADNVINVNGAKVLPQDVERELLSHPDVADAAVLGLPDPMSGECVVAFLVTRGPLAVQALLDFLRQRLAHWEIPVAYVGVDQLPRGPEGKVLLQPLRDFFVQQMRERDPGTAADTSPPSPAHETSEPDGPIARLIRWAQSKPDALALQDAHTRVTYAELLHGVCARAAWLHAAGIRSGDTVALSFSEPGGHWQQQVETFYGLAWLGATVLPLYPEIKEERRATFVDQLGARWLISQALPDTPRAQRLDPGSYVADQWASQQTPRGDAPSRPFHYEFTSGTTGSPKAMAPTHAEYSAMRSRAMQAYGWRTDDVAMAALRWPSKVGIRILVRTLFVGANFLDMPFPQTRMELAELVAKYRLSYLGCSPWQLRTLLSSPPLPGGGLVPLRMLSAIGAPVAPQEALTTRQTLVANFHVGYGSTEIGLMGYLGPEDAVDAPFRMLPGMQVQVRNDQGQVLPHGQIGRLCFRAPWLPTRYAVGDLHPVEGFHDGWFVSSDLGVLDTDGRLRVLGRADHAINVGGTKVMPQDVERVLLGHPDVADAAVIGMPDTMSGECVAAFLVLRQPLVVNAMVDYLRSRLEPTEIPVAYLGMDRIPRNPEGKVLVQPLRDLLTQKMRES